MRPRHTTVLAALLLITPLAAQEKPKPLADATRLADLLRQLEALPPDAWNARVAELEAKIAEHAKSAAELRERAKKLQADAAKQDAAAKTVRTEIERLRSLMTLVAPKGKPAAAAKPKPTPKPAAKPMPKAAPAADSKKAEAEEASIRLVSFEEHVFPIFDEHCTICHDDADTSGGLDLSNHTKALEGGGSGESIVPGRPDASRLFRMITRQEKPFMPRDGDPLDAETVETIRQWIALGAPADATAAKAAAAKMRAAQKKNAAEAAAPKAEIPPTLPKDLPPVSLAPLDRAPALKTVAASPHAPLLAAAGHGQVLLLHTESLELLGVLPFELGQVEVLEFTRDGRKLLVAGGKPGARGGAILFDVATGSALQKFGPERDTVLAAAISPGQSVVALGGPSRKVRAYSTEDGSRLYEITSHNDWVLSAAISPDGNWIATGDRGGIVEIHEADTGRPVHTLNPRGGAVHAVAFRNDAKFLAVAADDGKLTGWELEDGRRIWEKRHGRGALALAWSADNRLATSGDDGCVRVWKADGKPGGASKALGDWIYSLAFARGGRIWAGDWSGRLHVLDTDAKNVQTALRPALPRPSQ